MLLVCDRLCSLRPDSITVAKHYYHARTGADPSQDCKAAGMQKINESSELDIPAIDARKLLVSIDDSDECTWAMSWCQEHLYRYLLAAWHSP